MIKRGKVYELKGIRLDRISNWVRDYVSIRHNTRKDEFDDATVHKSLTKAGVQLMGTQASVVFIVAFELRR